MDYSGKLESFTLGGRATALSESVRRAYYQKAYEENS
jgi:hypothetical protein